MVDIKNLIPRLQGWRTALPCLGLVFMTTNAIAAVPAKPDEKVLSPMHSVVVPAKEYPAVVRDALAGSGEAAFRLAREYGMTGRITEDIFWSSIAAENGHQGAMYNLGYQLSQSPDPMQRLRARFWLNKVVASGNKDLSERARTVLKTLDEQERTNEANTAPRYGVYPKWPIE